MGSKGQNSFFMKKVMLHIKLQGKTFRALCKGGLDLAILDNAEYARTAKNKQKWALWLLQSKLSDYCLNCENITQSDCQEEEKRMTKYMCFQSILLMTIFFQYK